MKIRYILCLMLTHSGIFAMQKPTPKPGATQSETAQKKASDKKFHERELAYIEHLRIAETQANQMVDEAQNYYNAAPAIKKFIQQNPILSPKDKNDLMKEMESKLDDKFFPRNYIRTKGLPSAKNK